MRFASATNTFLHSTLRQILYHDKGIIILNKPPGLIAQAGNHEFSLARSQKPSQSANLGEPGTNLEDSTVFAGKSLSHVLEALRLGLELKETPYPVHRLDKGTTGCFVLAKNAKIARDLSYQFRDGVVKKSYLSLVCRAKFPTSSGRINEPLLNDDGRIHIAPKGQGKHALTQWEVIRTSRDSDVSMVKLGLLTGLKHQLRVHLSQCLQAPILGEEVYTRTRHQLATPGRIFLHAHELSFNVRPFLDHGFKETHLTLTCAFATALHTFWTF
jgi:23S rRNA-/tRNA-specific pseudouridylate synthase